MKKRVGIISAAAVLLVMTAAVWLWLEKKGAAEAVEACNAAVQAYNREIAPYNEAVRETEEANEAFQGVLEEAQASLKQGREPYEPETVEELQDRVNTAAASLVEAPARLKSMEEKAAVEGFDPGKWRARREDAEAALAAVESARADIPEAPAVPDYTEQIEAVRSAQKAYEDSVQKLANVTAAPEDFIAERLMRLDTVTSVQAVTGENDPNGLLGKDGGYVSCVYFSDSRVDRSLLPAETIDVILSGTAGGGAVEMYSSEIEAEDRMEYLAFFGGSALDPGYCAREKNCVIRISKFLEEEQQQKLAEDVREVLLMVD